MTVTTIAPGRVVPVQEDLATEELRLSVLRGLETMHRVDYPLADGAVFGMGEWAVLNADGKLERAGATGVPNSYLVFAGTDRFDVAGTGKATVVQNSGIVAKTTQYNPGGTYTVGAALTMKDWGTGESSLTPAGGGDAVLARVVSEANGVLTFESVRA